MTIEATHNRAGKSFIAEAHDARLRISFPDRLIEVDYPTPEMAETAFEFIDTIAGKFHYGPVVEVFGKPCTREQFVERFKDNLPRFFTIREVAR